jgi:hypothetical protein
MIVATDGRSFAAIAKSGPMYILATPVKIADVCNELLRFIYHLEIVLVNIILTIFKKNAGVAITRPKISDDPNGIMTAGDARTMSYQVTDFH